jgi:hypothetical protein
MMCLSSFLYGQAVSQISGTVTDQSGAAVPDVMLTATQTDTGVKRTAVSATNGFYLLPNLPLGPYKVEASKAGFTTFVQNGIILQVDSSANIPVSLGVGSVTQTVEVSATASLVETRNMGVGNVVETERILDLPLNGRNTEQLITLNGAASTTGTSPQWGMATGYQISVAGGVSYGVFYGLDGANISNFYDATSFPLPFPDALQEFKLETSSLNAAQGTHSGADVNGVTRSGTNTIHGDVFEFLRNGDLDARNYFAPARDTLKRNQFGGTIGGPIRKDKLFFFAGYQATDTRSDSAQNTAFIPTAAEAAGNFQVFASPQCQGRQINLPSALGFTNNILSPSLISPQAVAIASHFQTTTDPCGKVIWGNPTHENDGQIIGRIDYQLSNTQTIFGRYLATYQHAPVPYTISKSLLSTSSNGLDDLAQEVAVGHTDIISANMVNSLRLGMNREAVNHPGPSYFGPSDVGVNAYAYLPKNFDLSVTGGPSIGGGTGQDLFVDVTILNLNDDVTLIKGTHQFAFGGNLSHSLVDGLAHVFSQGVYSFTGGVSGLGMADFFLGDMSNFQQETPNGLIEAQYFFGLYGQDTWKVSSHLTLNYGVRWEPYFPLDVKTKQIYAFSLAGFYAGTVSTVYKNAPPGFSYPGDPGFNGEASTKNQWADFEPRIGFAWDPKGDGRMSLRGGAGIAYDFFNEQLNHNTDVAAPFGDRIVLPTANLANPWANYANGNIFPYFFSPSNAIFPSYASYQPIPYNLKTPKVYQWNLALQRQLTSKWFASASYVGNHAIHLLGQLELNPPQNLGFGSCTLTTPTGPVTYPVCTTQANENQRRTLSLANPTAAQNIGFITAYDDGGASSYHGLLLNTTYRVNSYTTLNANYTWSHCIGNYTVGTTVPNPAANEPNTFLGPGANRNLDRGNCFTDRRQNFNLTATAQSPGYGKSWANLLTRDWQLSVIFTKRTGDPLNVLAGTDAALTGTSSTQRPNQILGNVYGTGLQFLNPAAFAQPATGTLGNTGIYAVTGPAFFELDMALARRFAITERQHVEFRAEAFNLPNSLRASGYNSNGALGTNVDPAVSLSAGTTFGKILAANDPRIMELALKYVF